MPAPRSFRSAAPNDAWPSPRALSPDYVSDTRALWDAAYLLGSLTSNDRREFEAHLSTCPSCRESVTELSVMPALLAQLTRDDVAAIDERGSGAPQAAASALTMTPVASTALNSTVTISSHDWGTHIEMSCTYGNGHRTPATTTSNPATSWRWWWWVATAGRTNWPPGWRSPGVTATPSGSTSMQIEQIAAVQIVSIDDGRVLLQRRL